MNDNNNNNDNSVNYVSSKSQYNNTSRSVENVEFTSRDTIGQITIDAAGKVYAGNYYTITINNRYLHQPVLDCYV